LSISDDLPEIIKYISMQLTKHKHQGWH